MIDFKGLSGFMSATASEVVGGIPGVGDRALSHRLSQLSTGSRSRMGDEPWAQGASEFFRLKLDPEVLEKAILSRFKGPPNSSTPKSTV